MVEGDLRDDGIPEEVRETVGRAIRRIGILEWVLLGAIVVLSLLGGAVIALLVVSLVEVPFRITWGVASIVIFVVPAATVWRREMKGTKRDPSITTDRQGTGEHHG